MARTVAGMALLLGLSPIAAADEGTLRGIVVDAAGNPVQGAAVLVVPATEGEEEPPAAFDPPAVPRPGDPGDRIPVARRTDLRADEEGRFVVGGLAARPYWVLAGYEGMEEGWLRRTPAPEEFVLALPGPRELRGVVVDAGTGEPIAGAAVHAAADSGGRWHGEADAPTDEAGAFRIRGLLPGDYTVVADPAKPPRGTSTGAGATGHLDRRLAGVWAGRRDVVLRVERSLAISGTVVDDTGKPLEGIAMTANRIVAPGDVAPSREGTTTSDARGRFRIEGLGSGTYALTGGSGSADYSWMHPSMRSPPVEPARRRYLPGTLHGVAAGESEVSLVLARNLRVQGRILALDGRPLSGARAMQVRLLPVRDVQAREDGAVPASIDEQGWFDAGPLDHDLEYELEVLRPDGSRVIGVRDVQAGCTEIVIRVRGVSQADPGTIESPDPAPRTEPTPTGGGTTPPAGVARPIGGPREPPPPRPSVHPALRGRIDELVGSLRSLHADDGPLHLRPSLTAQVNALLSSPPDAVAAALEVAIDAELAAEHSDDVVRSIVSLLAGEGPTTTHRFRSVQPVALHGFAIAVPVPRSRFGIYGSLPATGPGADAVSPASLRPALRPRPFDLLKAILADGETRAGFGSTDEDGGTYLRTAGVELGHAAAGDHAFGRFLLAVAAEPSRGPDVDAVLVEALARWRSPEAVAALEARLRAELLAAADTGNQGFLAVVHALRRAGAGSVVARLRAEDATGAHPGRLWYLRALPDPDTEVRGLVEAARSDPTTARTKALATALAELDGAGLAVRRDAVRAAVTIRESTRDPLLRGWANAVMQNALWPGRFWRFGSAAGLVPPPDADPLGGLPNGTYPAGPEDHLLGAWPDPEEQARALAEDLDAGRLRVEFPGTRGPPPPLAPGEISLPADTGPGAGVGVTSRVESGRLVVTLRNGTAGRVGVSGVAPRYAVATAFGLAGRPAGRCEVTLHAGVLLPGHRGIVPATTLRILGPGESLNLEFACGKHAPGDRVVLSYRDTFEIEGDPGVPVVREIRGVRVTVP